VQARTCGNGCSAGA